MIYKSANREQLGELIRSRYSAEDLAKKGDVGALLLKFWIEDVHNDSKTRTAVARSMLRGALGLALLAMSAEDTLVTRHKSVSITNDENKCYAFGKPPIQSSVGDINEQHNLQIHFTGGQGLQAVRQSLAEVAMYLGSEGYGDSAPYITAVTYPRMSRVTRRFGFEPVPLLRIDDEMYDGIVNAERVFSLLNNKPPAYSEPEATCIPTQAFISLHQYSA